MRSIKRVSSKKRMLILSFLMLLLCTSIGYAVLSENLKISSSANVGKMTWDVRFENIVVREGSVNGSSTIESDKTSIRASLDLNKPGDYYEFYVDIVNKGSLDAKLDSLVKTALTVAQKKYLNYTITYKDYVEIQPNDLLIAESRDTIRVLIEVKELADSSLLPDSAFHLDLEGKFNYVQNDGEGVERSNNSLYNQIVKATQPDTNINFGAISSDTNGKGVYTLSKTSNTAYPVYYYRGEVENNNVIFANFCWKIIRTTNTGGVKLIYNGTPSNGVCNNTGEATEIGKSAFNTEHNDPKYVGYMYDNNTIDSTIKGAIDQWFATNLIDYQIYLEDTPFYNERDYVEGKSYVQLAYVPRMRIWGNDPAGEAISQSVLNTFIKLGATEKGDIFTVSSEIGNGALTYPVGLITSDEMVLAGGRGSINTENLGENKKYYLYTGAWYWSISPCYYNKESIAYAIRAHTQGYISPTLVSYSGGIRPVVSLYSGTSYQSGNGTSNSPYRIN